VIDAFFDLALEDDLRTQFTVAVMNTDAASVAEIFTHPRSLIGLSDAGAHLTLFCEAGQTSRLLGHWVRERRALSLEDGVRRITSMPADVFGLRDRGRLQPGLAADITVFDPDTIADHEPELVHDLPGGGPRLVQRASGIKWSFVNGRRSSRTGGSPSRREPAVLAACCARHEVRDLLRASAPAALGPGQRVPAAAGFAHPDRAGDRLGYDYAWEVEHTSSRSTRTPRRPRSSWARRPSVRAASGSATESSSSRPITRSGWPSGWPRSIC